MKNNLAAAPPKFPPVAILLLVLGVLLARFLPPLLGSAGTLAPAAGRAVAFGTLAAGGYLALRHYWAHDRPMFWRKVVLLVLAVVSITGLYVIINYAGIRPAVR